LEYAIKLNPNDAVFRSDLGLVCKQKKDFDCAIKQYQNALRLKPDAVTVATIHYNLGVLYEDRQEFDAALNQYQIAMQDKGELGANAINNFARLQIWKKHNNGLAINLLQNALRRTENPRLKSTLYKNLGWAYLQQVRYQEAQKYLREAIRLDKDKRAAAHCLLAKVLEYSNRTDALVSWEKCATLNSENSLEVETWQLDALRYLKAEGKQP
jgi:tetratricopeptide (TPR) repeat protein